MIIIKHRKSHGLSDQLDALSSLFSSVSTIHDDYHLHCVQEAVHVCDQMAIDGKMPKFSIVFTPIYRNLLLGGKSTKIRTQYNGIDIDMTVWEKQLNVHFESQPSGERDDMINKLIASLKSISMYAESEFECW